MKYKPKYNNSYCCDAQILFYGDDLKGFCSKCEKEISTNELRYK